VTPLVLAAAVSMCPAYEVGDTMPLTILQGCPAPIAGLLYSLDHASVDREAGIALTNCGARADSCAGTIEKMPEPPSRLAWAGVGLLGAALVAVAILATTDLEVRHER